MCSRNCCLALGLYQYHRLTAYTRECMSLGFVLCLYSDDCFPQICFFYICMLLFHLLTDRGVETRRGGWGYISPNNLTVSPPIIWVESASASPPIIWLWCAFERRSPLQFGKQSFPSFGEDLIFWSSLNLLTWKKSWSRFIPPKLKIAQNWGKIASYPPQYSTKMGTPAHLTS